MIQQYEKKIQDLQKQIDELKSEISSQSQETLSDDIEMKKFQLFRIIAELQNISYSYIQVPPNKEKVEEYRELLLKQAYFPLNKKEFFWDRSQVDKLNENSLLCSKQTIVENALENLKYAEFLCHVKIPAMQQLKEGADDPEKIQSQIEHYYKLARIHYVYAALLNHPFALAELGWQLLTDAVQVSDISVQNDIIRKANDCLAKAMDLNCSYAFFIKGIQYLNGNGEEKNLSKALSYLRKASEYGYKDEGKTSEKIYEDIKDHSVFLNDHQLMAQLINDADHGCKKAISIKKKLEQNVDLIQGGDKLACYLLRHYATETSEISANKKEKKDKFDISDAIEQAVKEGSPATLELLFSLLDKPDLCEDKTALFETIFKKALEYYKNERLQDNQEIMALFIKYNRKYLFVRKTDSLLSIPNLQSALVLFVEKNETSLFELILTTNLNFKQKPFRAELFQHALDQAIDCYKQRGDRLYLQIILKHFPRKKLAPYSFSSTNLLELLSFILSSQNISLFQILLENFSKQINENKILIQLYLIKLEHNERTSYRLLESYGINFNALRGISEKDLTPLFIKRINGNFFLAIKLLPTNYDINYEEIYFACKKDFLENVKEEDEEKYNDLVVAHNKKTFSSKEKLLLQFFYWMLTDLNDKDVLLFTLSYIKKYPTSIHTYRSINSILSNVKTPKDLDILNEWFNSRIALEKSTKNFNQADFEEKLICEHMNNEFNKDVHSMMMFFYFYDRKGIKIDGDLIDELKETKVEGDLSIAEQMVDECIQMYKNTQKNQKSLALDILSFMCKSNTNSNSNLSCFLSQRVFFEIIFGDNKNNKETPLAKAKKFLNELIERKEVIFDKLQKVYSLDPAVDKHAHHISKFSVIYSGCQNTQIQSSDESEESFFYEDDDQDINLSPRYETKK